MNPPKAKIPLNVKISLLTVGLVSLAVVLMVWLHYANTREEIIRLHQMHLIHVASTAALSLESDTHAVLGGRESMEWPAFKQMRDFLLAVKDKNRLEMPLYTLRKVSEDEVEYVVTTHAMGRVGTRRPITPKMASVFERGEDTVTGLYSDERGVWLSAYAPIKSPSGEVEAALAVDFRADKLLAELTARRRLTFIYAASVLVAALVLSLVFTRTVTGPLRRLLEATRALALGDYAHEVEVSSRDEVGELAEGFESMRKSLKDAIGARDRLTADLSRTVKELERSLKKVELLEKVKDHLAKFVPGRVVSLIEAAPEKPALAKKEMDVSVLFLDVVGYTRLSEEVEHDRMSYIIERYFSNFIDPIQENRGDINETAGDGLMIIFQHPDPAEHAVRAVAAARAIRVATDSINAEEAVIHADGEGDFRPIGIKFGINSGAAIVGASKFEGLGGDRYTYTASGPVTNVASRIVDLAEEGEILLSEETAQRVSGSFVLERKGAYQLKNVRDAVTVYQVVMPRDMVSQTEEEVGFPP